MPQGSTAKGKRQNERIKAGSTKRGVSASRTKKVTTRAVSKDRAPVSAARTISRTSHKNTPAARRSGLSSRTGPASRTYDQLYAEARRRRIEGRSSMRKADLIKALGR